MPDWFKHIFKWDCINQHKKEYKPVTNDISVEEISQAIKKMAPHKAGGPSGVTADMLKAAPPIILDLLAEYCTMALRAGNIPHNAKEFNLWCIDKAPGAGKWISADLTAKLGVRPISLFEVTTKLLERILATRLNGVINKHKFLHKAQMGFSENISAVEAMLLYMHIVEDAHINKKNIYLSSNDCSQAYDSVAPWVMKLIYQYHGFPQEIITLLHNMDKGQSGTILTGAGPTDPFEKFCGLGQGSSLAPLKWNLYLDPLLRWLDELEDKYVINGEGIAVGAFADDTVFISTTHEGYLERMRRGGTYFNFFGTEFNGTKTKLLYNLPDQVAPPAPAEVFHLREKRSSTCSVVPPKENTRILGGQFNMAMEWKESVSKYTTNTCRSLRLLDAKKLTMKEARTVINMVIHGRNRYFVNAFPLMEKETKQIDSAIATTMKHTVNMAQSANSAFVFDSALGLGMLATECVRTQQLIIQSLISLNADTTLGKFSQQRFRDTARSLGKGLAELGSTRATTNITRKSGMARLNDVLHHLGWTIRSQETLRTRRTIDTELVTITIDLPNDVKRQLRLRGWAWLSQLSSRNGKYMRSWYELTKSRSNGPKWFQILRQSITLDGNRLLYTVSPEEGPEELPFKTGGTIMWHEISSNSYRPKFGIITAINEVTEEISVCPLTQKWCNPKSDYIEHNGTRIPAKWRKGGDPPLYWGKTKSLNIKFKDMVPIEMKGISTYESLTGNIKTTRFIVFDTTEVTWGPNSMKGSHGYFNIMKKIDDLAKQKSDSLDTSSKEDEHKDHDTEGETPPSLWWAATDGSLSKSGLMGAGAYAMNAKSHKEVCLNCSIDTRQDELNSYRAELAAVLMLLRNIPQDDNIDLTMDNEAAAKLVQSMTKGYRKSGGEIIFTPARSIILELEQRVKLWRGEIRITRIDSHMEHINTDDSQLDARRDLLCKADKLAAIGGESGEPLLLSNFSEKWSYALFDQDNLLVDGDPAKAIRNRWEQLNREKWLMLKTESRILHTDIIKQVCRVSDTLMESVKYRMWMGTLPLRQRLFSQLRATTPFCQSCIERGTKTEETFDHIWFDCPSNCTHHTDLARKIQKTLEPLEPLIPYPPMVNKEELTFGLKVFITSD